MSPPSPPYERLPSPSPSPAGAVAGGFMQRVQPLAASRPFLPHLLQAVTALKVSKASIGLALAEHTIFLRPPLQLAEDDETEGGWDSAPKEGSGGVVHGLVNIVSLERRVVEDVRVCLAGQQRLVHPMGAIEAFEAYRQTLSLAAVSGSTRIELERGVNSFEFSLPISATTMPSVQPSPFGRLKYTVKASVPGSGNLLRPALSAEEELVVVAIPKQADDNARFEIDESSSDAWSGPLRLNVFTEPSQRLLLGGPLALRLTLPSPPPNLTIFGLQLSVDQTAVVRSPHGRASTRTCPKRVLLSAGYFDNWADPAFPERARETHLDDILLDGQYKLGLGEDGWFFSGTGFIPEDNLLRPSTLYHTPKTPGVVFKHEIALRVFFQQTGVPDERLMIATLCRRPVVIASASCSGQSLVLPVYSATSD